MKSEKFKMNQQNDQDNDQIKKEKMNPMTGKKSPEYWKKMLSEIQTAFKKVELLSKSKPDYFKGEYIKTEQKMRNSFSIIFNKTGLTTPLILNSVVCDRNDNNTIKLYIHNLSPYPYQIKKDIPIFKLIKGDFMPTTMKIININYLLKSFLWNCLFCNLRVFIKVLILSMEILKI
jgi:hypothetical protein